MRIIFLDIDGVLNTRNHIKWRMAQPPKKRGSQLDWCGQACVNVNNLATKVDGRAGIVISSTWRIGTPILELRQMLEYNGITVPVVDKTPELGLARGEEIDEWLRSSRRVGGVRSYVIIDDDNHDFIPTQKKHLVHVDSSDGFANFGKLEQAIKILSQ